MSNVPHRLQHLNTWCHSLLSVVVPRTTAKSNLKRKGIIWFVCPETVNHWGKPRQKSKMDRNLEELEQRLVKTASGLTPMTRSAYFLISPRTIGLGWLCSPLSNINQENIPQVSLQANRQEAVPQLRSSSSQITRAYIKETIKLISMLDS